METIEITNFGGRLTRIKNGDLNSGFAKFDTSFGYDPFSKPMNLTWFDKPVNLKSSIAGGSLITDLILAGKIRNETVNPMVYMIGNSGNLYKVNPSPLFNTPYPDSVVGVASVRSGTDYTHGASMEFAARSSVEAIYIGHDNGVNNIRFDGSDEQQVGNQTYYITGISRPLKQFIGQVNFANGPTFGAIGATGIVTSPVVSVVSAIPQTASIVSIYSQISPPLPPETVIQDLDVTPNLDYLLMTTNDVVPNVVNTPFQRQGTLASSTTLYQWNGIDDATTAGTQIGAYSATALQTYLQRNLFFSNDVFGSSVSDGVNKILTLPNNQSPTPNATGSTGNFLYWACPENNNGVLTATLYYFGRLDEESPSGLYRLTRINSSLSNGFVVGTPMALLVSNYSKVINNSYSSIATIGYGKHYISTLEANSTLQSTGTGSVLGFYGFSVNSSEGIVAPQLGKYETQTQLFSKKVGISQMRVYCEATVTGNGFQIDIIGGDGAVVDNGSFTYSFVAGSEQTQMQGALERINFNPTIKTLFAIGIRVTNTGTTNMTIKKIEVDISDEGK